MSPLALTFDLCEGGTENAWKRRAYSNKEHRRTLNKNKHRPAVYCAGCWAFICSIKYLVATVDKLIKVDLECNQAEHFATP